MLLPAGSLWTCQNRIKLRRTKFERIGNFNPTVNFMMYLWQQSRSALAQPLHFAEVWSISLREISMTLRISTGMVIFILFRSNPALAIHTQNFILSPYESACSILDSVEPSGNGPRFDEFKNRVLEGKKAADDNYCIRENRSSFRQIFTGLGYDTSSPINRGPRAKRIKCWEAIDRIVTQLPKVSCTKKLSTPITPPAGQSDATG